MSAGRGGRAAGRGVLVAGQLALTLVLLAGAGLMAASFARLSSIDVGFRNENVLAVRFERGAQRTADESRHFDAALLERVRALPGVTSAAIAPCPPLTGRCEVFGLRRVDDQPPVDFGDMQGILGYVVSDDYFATLGIETRAGRTFDGSEIEGRPPVAIVNETAAREFFDGRALGHRLAVTHEITPDEGGVTAEIVGVVADVRYGALEAAAMPAVYFSRRQAPSSYGTLFVLSAGDPLELVSAVRGEAAALDPDMPLYDVTTLADLHGAATARTRIVLGLLAAFACAGLLLSAIGLYGIVSYGVVRRTREMGLRVALGAAAGDVMRLVLAPPAAFALGGAAIGLLGALVLTRFATALLYGTAPTDVRVLGAATFALLAIALVAAWLPARRATRIDPAIALRNE